MNGRVTTYIATVVGAVALLAHLVWSLVKHKRPPPLARLFTTLLSGAGIVPGIQLCVAVFAPPRAKQSNDISVDDYRIALVLGAIALIAMSCYGLRESWKSSDPKSAESNTSRKDGSDDA